MKRKFISKLLAGCIVFSNLNNLYSLANTDTSGRYQTLEGEYITINNSTDGEIDDIELYGNTIQDPDNLEDVQSVGDLYVDENGNPILDKQGRKQYKIKIKSYNGPIKDGLICWIDARDGLNENDALPDRTGNGNDLNLGTATYTGNSIEYTNQAISYIDLKNISSANVTVEIGIKLNNPESTAVRMLYELSDNYNGNQATFTGTLESAFGLPYSFLSNVRKSGYQIIANKNFKASDKIYHISSSLAQGNEPTTIGTLLNNVFSNEAVKSYNDTNKIAQFDFNKRFFVGNRNATKSLSLNGKLYYLRIYNRVLSKDEMIFNQKYEETISRDNRTLPYISEHTILLPTQLQKLGDVADRLCWDNSKGRYIIEKNVSTEKNNITVYYKSATPKYIDTNITSKIKIPTYEGYTVIYTEIENRVKPTLKVVVDRTINRAKEAIEIAKSNPTTENLAQARYWINLLDESILKDELQSEVNDIFNTEDLIIDKKQFSVNTDVYIKANNSLSLSLDTNNVTFDDFSSTEDIEKLNTANLTIKSSLPYILNVYLEDEIYNSDKSEMLDKTVLGIKTNNSDDYQSFTDISTPLLLLEEQAYGTSNNIGVDLKLFGGLTHKADVYKTTLKLEVVQR